MENKIVLVTGANAGLGLETCAQLAEKGVGKIILACRSEKKAKDAVQTLVSKTGKPESRFKILVMDTGDLDSCRGAADSVDGPLDAIVMNAGGMIFTVASKSHLSGAHNQFAVNVLGHVVFLEELISKNKLAKGAHVMFSGSEGSRGVAAMGMKRCKYTKPYKEDMIKHITGKAYKTFDPMKAYQYTKSIGQLCMSKLAADNPDYTIVSVSPGATTGTKAANDMPAYMRLGYKFFMAGPMKAIGHSHSVSKGAENYLSGIGMGPVTVPTGKFYGAPIGKSSGKLVDQGEKVDRLYDSPEAQAAAYEAVKSFLR